MSQHDMVIDNQTFPSTRSDLNNALQALVTTSKGNSRPSTVYAGQPWIDDNTPSSTLWTLNYYDGTADVPIGLIDSTNHRFVLLDPLYAGTAGGTANSLTLTPTPAVPAYYVGMTISFLAASDNTSSSVGVNVSGLGLRDIQKQGSSSLAANDIRAGKLCVLQYDGTEFQLINPGISAFSVASQAVMESASSTVDAVTPARQQYHPSAAKFWVKHDDGTTINASYNVSSITDHGTGDHTVNFSTAFSSADYCVVALSATVTHPCQDGAAPATGSVRIQTRTPGPSSILADAGRYYVAGFGDQ